MTEETLQISLDEIQSLVESDPKQAAEQLRQFLRSDPLSANAYRMLARALKGAGLMGSVTTAGIALHRAAQALYEGDLETTELILRPRLREKPDDTQALQLLAEFATRLDYDQEAENLLKLALEIEPDSSPGRIQLAAFLYRKNRPQQALELLDAVLSVDSVNMAALNLRASALARAGQTKESLAAYEKSLQIDPDQPQVWSFYGQVLRTLGRIGDAIAALRQAIELTPQSGEVWWSLSDLKTHRFEADDIARMEAALDRSTPGSKDEKYFQFALGKAFEDAAQYEQSFAYYSYGNELLKRSRNYDPNEVSRYVATAKETFSKQFFAERAEWGVETADPIFVLGMPRSGSTLLEQILGRHPQIEATMELPELLELGESLAPDILDLPSALLQRSREEMAKLGETYVDRTRRYRKTSKPMFVDKMPNNWLYVPLIQLALPRAKIIDVRRNPLDCCVSNFKQLFLTRQGFSNDLNWLGRYYRDYVLLMRHIDDVLPGRVHRVIYEDLVADNEGEVRRLLDYISVPFDAACLKHNEGDALVRTTSADQVRRPINSEGIGSSKPFEPWLGPLKDALGDVLTSYRH